MGNPAGVRRDFQALEQRRWRAARLLKKGVHQSEVARRVGAHRQSVSRWAQQLEEAGLSGLKKAGRAGRKPRLSPEDLGRLWLEFLPAYAPELNPVEYLWSHWKQHELPNFCPTTFGQLSHYARQALRRMRRRPALVVAFWQQANLFPL